MASPICLPFSASTSHVLGTCAVEKVRGVLSVTERDKQQLLSPSGKPRGNESSWWFFLFVALRTFRAHSAGWWITYTLSTARNRQEGCHLQGLCCVGQSCKPNMPWFMEPSFPGSLLWPQCGGFMAPCPRCCFCFCCINNCSRAEGPGCIMELDQIDFRLSMRTAEESSMEGPWPVQVPLGVLA